MSWIDRDNPSVRYVAASLIAGVFFGGLAGGVAFPTLPQLGTLLGISSLLVGLILSINRFTRLLMNTPAGQILDRIGTRKPMIAGFFVQALAPFGYALALHAPEFNVPSSSVFLVSRALWGVGSAFVFVGAFSTITHITTQENRGKWIGYMRGGQSLGFPTGLVAGGLITDVYGFEIAFLTAGVAGMFSAIVAFAVLPDISPDVGATSRLREIPNIIQADPRVFTIGTVNFIVRFLFAGVLLSTVVLFAGANNINIGTMSETGVSGIVMAISVVFASVTTVFVGRKSDSLSNRAYVTIPALALLAAGFAVLSVFPTLEGTILGVGMIGVGVGGTNPPLVAFLGDISPSSDVGKMGGVYNVFGDLGSTAGPIVALPLVDYIGFSVGYLVCVGLVVLTGVLVVGTLFGSPVEPVNQTEKGRCQQ